MVPVRLGLEKVHPDYKVHVQRKGKERKGKEQHYFTPLYGLNFSSPFPYNHSPVFYPKFLSISSMFGDSWGEKKSVYVVCGLSGLFFLSFSFYFFLPFNLNFFFLRTSRCFILIPMLSKSLCMIYEMILHKHITQENQEK